AFFDLYMAELAQLMGVKVDGLADFQSSLKFVDGSNEAVGCGAFHPLEKVASASSSAPRKAEDSKPPDPLTKSARNPSDRRVEIVFFKPADVPKLTCHASGSCKPDACEIYGGQFSLVHVPSEGLLKPRLTSRYALDLFEKTAAAIVRGEFVAWMSQIFGTDIPTTAYES